MTRRTLVAAPHRARRNGGNPAGGETISRLGTHRTAASDRSPAARTLSVADAAKLLGISRTLAYECVNRGELPSIRLGARIVVPTTAIDEILTRATNGGPTAQLAG
jgi:excisionase family DNA binding protein